MDEESFIRLVNSQTQALTQVAMISTSTKEVLEKVVENQSTSVELLKQMAATQEEFRGRTFNALAAVIVFLVLVVAGLMYKLNMKGAEEIGSAVTRMANPPVPGTRPKW